MTGQDCTAIIAAIGSAQVAMVGALGALYLKLRSTERLVKSNGDFLQLANGGKPN